MLHGYKYVAYGKCTFLNWPLGELDPQESAKDNPYLFTGRRLDMLDLDSLAIQYNINCCVDGEKEDE